jgi:putative IMPACT (imprinted ancient) family translation regulator
MAAVKRAKKVALSKILKIQKEFTQQENYQILKLLKEIRQSYEEMPIAYEFQAGDGSD